MPTNQNEPLSKPIKETITRKDPPLDHKYRIVVKEWTPGKNGQPGTAKVELKKIELKKM